jgi:flagellar basal body rod protein FlgG
MIYGLWQAAEGLQAQEYRQAVIANNLANAETRGFKPERIAFQERLNASPAKGPPGTRHPVLDGMTGGMFETEVYTDFNAPDGAVIPSDNPFDVALQRLFREQQRISSERQLLSIGDDPIAAEKNDRIAQTEDATTATTALSSEMQDVDFTEAVTKFQQAQTALQASLQMASQSLNLSLFDFRR